MNPSIQRLGVPVVSGGVPEQGKRELLALYPDAKLNDLPRGLTEDEMIGFLADCDAAIIGLDLLSERVIDALPKLKIVGKFGAGYDTVDLKALKRRGIQFGYTFGVNALAVAELTVASAIMGLRHVPALNLAMREGERPRWIMGRLLSGRTVGIHGCGHIGKALVRLLQPFGCEILANDIRDYSDFYQEYGVKAVDLDELLGRSEILTLHLAKSRLTTGLYDRATLAKIREGAVFINTCRGGIVDEVALLERLEGGHLTAACFDVFAIEPAQNDTLLRHPNMLATPHMGAAIEEVRVAMFRSAIRGLVENGPVQLENYDF
ncbi:MAG TPA: NAD(P)-dependent oxidoreductase [Caulobacteraceae bacterium]